MGLPLWYAPHAPVHLAHSEPTTGNRGSERRYTGTTRLHQAPTPQQTGLRDTGPSIAGSSVLHMTTATYGVLLPGEMLLQCEPAD